MAVASHVLSVRATAAVAALTSAAQPAASARQPRAAAGPARCGWLSGSRLESSRRTSPILTARGASSVEAAIATVVGDGIKNYARPDWATFEMGHGSCPVFWESINGVGHNSLPESGKILTIYYHPEGTNLDPTNSAIFFNGGFNGPLMCGSEPRPMSRRGRGSACLDFYSIRVNVPRYARTMEFSFSDGTNWDGRYLINFKVPDAFKSKPDSFFQEGLALELGALDACDKAIFPDIVNEAFRCAMPGGTGQEGGDRCDLDIKVGCMDPASPSYDPFAIVDDGSCDLPPR